MGEKNYNDPESELTVNRNNVTYQYSKKMYLLISCSVCTPMLIA